MILADPAVDRSLRQMKQLGKLSNGKIHGHGQRVATIAESTGSAEAAQISVD
jgi:hypothetical protein